MTAPGMMFGRMPNARLRPHGGALIDIRRFVYHRRGVDTIIACALPLEGPVAR